MADTIPRRDVVLTTRVGLEHSRLSRRLLLQRGGAAALGLGLMPTLLAACGGDDGGDAAAPQASGPLDFLSWEGYDMPVKSVDKWKKDNGVEIRATYIGNHDDIQAKIASGGRRAPT